MASQDSLKLIVKAGPSPGQEFKLTKPETIIGRDPSADCVISHKGVSHQHARITRLGDGHLLEDLASTNGTFLNGQRLTGAMPLNSGDEIKLGQSISLIFEAPTVEADSEIAGTVIYEGSPPIKPTEPPQFAVAIAGSISDVYTLTKDLVTVGRADDNDIVISSKIVSRHHARLERADGGYQIVVLPKTRNPLYLEGGVVTASRRLQHEDKLRIGGKDPGVMVTMTYLSPTEAVATEEAIKVTFEEKNQIKIGRDPSNDIVLDVPYVSGFHAQIERVGKRQRVSDLGSTNGTFVNDQEITGKVWLKPNDSVRIGPYRFVIGKDVLTQYDDSSSLRVEAIGLNKWVRPDLNILQNISLLIQPREFIVVVGQSGGGKSTLVDAIAGYRPATHGQVFVNDTDVYRNFDVIRNLIGFVPQQDIIHMELTVFEALDYTAKLRMPPDTTKAERHKRVVEVLEDMDLLHRKDLPIRGLSGGQQKRVSIGVELLAKPGLFFLDEPTSGLDPGTETALMQLMRRLADQGRTIILITHATKNVMLADKVIFLARGGYLTWFGPPDEALEYFNQYRSKSQQRASEMEFDQIYAILEDSEKGTPEKWAERYKNHLAYVKYIVEPLSSKGREVSMEEPLKPAIQPVASQVSRRVSAWRQFLILSARNIRILARDRFSLALMLAAAPLVGLLGVLLAVLLGRNPFDFTDGNFKPVVITLFLMTIYGVMVGGLAQMREIVKEGDIYKRERLVNLKMVPYVLAKVWFVVLLALYQAATYVIIHYLAFDMPGGTYEFILIYISLALATMAGMMLGLFASALAPNANSVPLIVILLIIPQIVLGGALVQVPGFVSAPTSTRWAFEAIMSITGSGSDIAADVCWDLPEQARKAMTLEDKETNDCRCLGTNILRQDSCNFPGIGIFYNEIIDQPPPEELPPPADRPPDPVIPDPPPEPINQADVVAMSEYVAAVKEYQTQVEQIQTDAEAEFAAYEADLEIYQAQAIANQEALVNWQIAREVAVLPAEAMLDRFNKEYGWAFVNKEDPSQFSQKILKTWMAQGIIISILFVGILILQKRKDVH